MSEHEHFQNRQVTMNPKNNLLQIEEHMYILDDVSKPNVFRNMFPYSEVPKIPFNILSGSILFPIYIPNNTSKIVCNIYWVIKA